MLVVIGMIILAERFGRAHILDIAFERFEILFGAHRGGGLGLLAQQRVAIFLGDLVIIGMDF